MKITAHIAGREKSSLLRKELSLFDLFGNSLKDQLESFISILPDVDLVRCRSSVENMSRRILAVASRSNR